MSDEETKRKKSKRIMQDDNAVNRQVKIAKSHGLILDEPHKYAKKHAMNCGDPKCVMCGNPRKVFKERTYQENKMMQDTENVRERHSNGQLPD